MQINYYIIPFILGLIISTGFILYVLKTKPTSNYRVLVALASGCLWWLLFSLLDIISMDTAYKILWNHLSFIGVVTVTLSFFSFTVQYVMGKKWLTWKNILAICIIPVAFLVLDFTNKYHWLSITDYRIQVIDGYSFLVKQYGPVFWTWTVYAYLLIILSYYLLIRMLVISLRYYKWYSLLLIIASTLPISANIIYLSEALPLSHYDPTPIALVLSIVIILYGMTRLKIGELMPFTRESLVENMQDGMILLNSENRIIDFNSVADYLIGDGRSTNHRGRYIGEVWKKYGDDFEEIAKYKTEYREIPILRDNKKTIYEMQISPFYDYRNKITNKLITFRDITERKKAEERIIFLSFHDKLTGLYNRAYFEEELSRLDTARHLPLSFLIGDINGLKLVNDAFGHSEGDNILKKVSRILKKNCRECDIIARWGGDEFAILLPNTDKDLAESIAKRIRSACNRTKDQKIPLSISLGIAAKEKKDEQVDDVIRRAEDRMYRSKLLEKKSIANSIISSLERTLQEKSHETKEHADRLKYWAVKIGRKLDLPESRIDELILLSSLHDIGKIIIPDEILNKKEELSKEEWKLIKKHPEAGHNIAESSSQLAPISEAILCHHEWWDGSGYPYGIKGESIPLTARIIAVVDAYDVICNGRIYKDASSNGNALEELKRFSGKQFDPKIVDIFLKIIDSENICYKR